MTPGSSFWAVYAGMAVSRPYVRERNSCSIFIAKRSTWGGRKLVLETGKIARQADGAVLATYGETVVLATVVSANYEPKAGQDFFPLTVNYQEKYFAAGKIPGGYFKREGRPTEKRDAGLPPDRPSDPPAVRRRATRTRPRSSSRAAA